MSHRLVVLGTLGALCCALAACGSSNSTSTTAASGSSSGTGTTASAGRRAALAACLKQRGVTLPAFRGRPPGSGAPGGGVPGGGVPGGGVPGGGVPGGGTPGGGAPPAGAGRGFFGGRTLNAKTRAAFTACGANFGAGAGARFRTLSRAGITSFVACVRQHGYKLPSPNFSGNGPTFPANIRTNAKFQAASRACASLLRPPGGAPPGATATPTTTSS